VNYLDAIGEPTEAGYNPPSASGLFDISGNTWEWCNDWHTNNLTGPVVSPQGPANGVYKTIRSGSFLTSEYQLRCATRSHIEEATARYKDAGFRCAEDYAEMGAESVNMDQNANGVPDWWELWHYAWGSDAPVSSFEATSDSDGDGLTDIQEYRAGSNPHDGESVFEALGSQTEQSGDFSAAWPSVSDQKYTVLRTANLMEPFEVIATDIPATPPINKFTDLTADGAKSYYYRILVQ